MAILEYDSEATRRLLAIYITPDVEEQRNTFVSAFNPQPGQRILDVGSGPGFLVELISDRVGQSGYVSGIDISKSLLNVASTKFGDKKNVEFRLASATKLPFPSDDFDTVISTQVLEYVPDIYTALQEVRRVLKTGGSVALLDTDWDSIVWYSPDRVRMNRILKAWEQHAADPFLPRTLSQKLTSAGFEIQSRRIIPIFNNEFNENTYSNRLIDLIIPFIVDAGDVTIDEAKAWAQDLRERGRNGDYFFSLNRYFFLAKKM